MPECDERYERLLPQLTQLIEENCPKSMRRRRGCINVKGGCASELAETLAFNGGGGDDMYEAVETAMHLCKESDW